MCVCVRVCDGRGSGQAGRKETACASFTSYPTCSLQAGPSKTIVSEKLSLKFRGPSCFPDWKSFYSLQEKLIKNINCRKKWNISTDKPQLLQKLQKPGLR